MRLYCRLAAGCVLASLLFAVEAHAAPNELTILSGGETVGRILADENEGRVTVDYEVNNNGRGPRHREEIVLGDKEIPVAYTVQGRSLMGGAVDEAYRWDKGKASWRSQADKGTVAAPAPRLYIVNDGSPYSLAIYARALLADPDRTIDVLPGGRLRIEKVRELTVGEGARAMPATVYRIDGINLTPDYVVLDRDNRFFGTLGGAIRRGYESTEPVLRRLGRELGAERARALQGRLAHRFTGPVRIRNVRIFDPKTRRLSDISTVVVMMDRITQILPGRETGSAPPGQAVIEGENGVLVSGLHDMHSHSSVTSGLFYLAAGVTSLRDMGNSPAFLFSLIRDSESGVVAAPRIVRNGMIEGRSEFAARGQFVVASQEEALNAVRWYADRGYWQIKIYNSMNPEWVPAMAAEAHRRGLGVTGHIPAFTSPDAMIRAGYNDIAHINQLMLGWLIRPGEDTRTPLRLTAMERAADLDLNSAPVQTTIDLMRSRNVALDTTTVILERLMLSRAGTVADGDAAYLDHMPIGYQRYRRRTFVPLTSPDADQRYRRAFDRILQTMRLLHEKGIRMLPGTDDGTGFTVHRELELYQRAGIPAAEVLANATLGMEEYLGRSHELGSIERGKLADFFLIADDPTRDITAVRRPRMVMRGGIVYLPNEIYDALGIRPFTQPPQMRAATPDLQPGGDEASAGHFSSEEEEGQ